MRIVLVGPPGAGKGTQAHFIASHLSIPRISTGDIFRFNVANSTELGAKAKEFMDRGDPLEACSRPRGDLGIIVGEGGIEDRPGRLGRGDERQGLEHLVAPRQS